MQFSDFGIKPQVKAFVGDKIKTDRILNREVTVEAFVIEDSNYKDKGSGKRLKLQLEVSGEKRILFNGSVFLMDMIKRVPDNGFPFKTKIVKVDGHYEFT